MSGTVIDHHDDKAVDTLLLGSSPAMQRVRDEVRCVARGTASVLVTGPSGSGKERVAQAIHAASDRAAGPFVAINCGAIPRELLESELFGHERGSFTGAHAARAGRFEEAEGGTLFLDEIGDMPVDMQVKLLRVLEERVVQRVGGRSATRVDVRIISATHRDIGLAIANGQFREDLFYRLAVFPVDLPALGARLEDLPELVAHFTAAGKGRRPARFAEDGMARLAAHDWPGNLRELRNVVERAAILHPGEAIAAHAVERLLNRNPTTSAAALRAAQPGVGQPCQIGAGVDLRALLDELEERYIRAALERSGGVVAEAARLLGLRRTTLIEKLRRHALA